jgi:hypothetical protein
MKIADSTHLTHTNLSTSTYGAYIWSTMLANGEVQLALTHHS